jgi:hypothetical protein
MIAEACVEKPVRIATRLGITGELLHALVPRVAQIVMNSTFRMFPTAPRQGRQGQEVPAFSRGDRDAADDARDSLLSDGVARPGLRFPTGPPSAGRSVAPSGDMRAAANRMSRSQQAPASYERSERCALPAAADALELVTEPSSTISSASIDVAAVIQLRETPGLWRIGEVCYRRVEAGYLVREGRAFAERARHVQGAAEVVDQGADDCQADARAFAAPRRRGDDLVGLEQRRQHLLGNPGPVSATTKRSRSGGLPTGSIETRTSPASV